MWKSRVIRCILRTAVVSANWFAAAGCANEMSFAITTTFKAPEGASGDVARRRTKRTGGTLDKIVRSVELRKTTWGCFWKSDLFEVGVLIKIVVCGVMFGDDQRYLRHSG